MNKPDSADGAFHAFPDHRVISLSGRDALAFAQAQVMNDVALLADGQWQWNGWLTPKGRVIALFALLRRGPDSLWLLLQDADADETALRLRRFVFRSKVAIDVRTDLQVQGGFTAPGIASQAMSSDSDAAGIELDMGGDGGPRCLRITPTFIDSDHADAVARWRAADLAHGLPRLDASQAGQWTPQQLSLQRLRAFSVKKGCYPGQEIVARTHFLGQAKRSLVLLDIQRQADPGSQVEQDGRVIGQVVSAAAGTRASALAVLPEDRSLSPLVVDGLEAPPLPLLAGLAR